jgi:hypothetical protein
LFLFVFFSFSTPSITEDTSMYFIIDKQKDLTLGPGCYTCPNLCGKSYFTVIDMQRHIQFECESLRKWKCSRCSKNFKRKYHLQRHEATHRKEPKPDLNYFKKMLELQHPAAGIAVPLSSVTSLNPKSEYNVSIRKNLYWCRQNKHRYIFFFISLFLV